MIEPAAPDATAAAMPATQGVPEADPTPDEAHAHAHTDAHEADVLPPIESTGEIAADTKLSKLDIPALQARYREVIGRATTSTSRTYLLY
ncbi:MAG: hypothetical protein KGR26_05655, partial [Cyanobacteria bacterium REEB65]|nr:hypothetical protein [Cyanobacteria bacterium REEB65]